ncbi:MAG TPA: ABC transporter permease subunit [Candidatus Binataceae bacterium]|nr:ABC transporter permease subunit [Candidatus Binataceae bacterium]
MTTLGMLYRPIVMNTSAINFRRFAGAAFSFLMLAGIIALFFAYRGRAGALHAPRFSVSARQLPYYAFCSFYRMLAAYAIALLFSIVYGLGAARGRAWERVMIPAIDIAQSVPVVGFFPAAVYFFVSIAHGRLGVELAAIFLIFTSQAWNMALGVFESARTIPADSIELFEAFGAGGWLKLKRLLLPACVPKLVYNSILSWVAGWYFLIACEIITVGPAHYRLPGLGSYLMEAADKGRSGEILAGLLTLLAIIVAMDFMVWQPLSAWSEKFRYEFAASTPDSEAPAAALPMVGALYQIGPTILRGFRLILAPPASILRAIRERIPAIRMSDYPSISRTMHLIGVAAMLGLLAFFAWAILDGLVALVRALDQPWPADARLIPIATLASLARLIVAYAISLAWIVPCTLAASSNARLRQRLASIAEIVGSVPATALFPLIVVFVIEVTGGMNLASILLILTGMQWYLLFNLLAGVSQIPEDLKEATRSFGLSRMATWRKLVLPAVTPSLITGSITAWGGGWNALILSEYFVYRSHTYHVLGLGALLDVATYQTSNTVMILLSLLSMIAVVIVLNRLVWRRLYDLAVERYRLDY